MNMDSSASELSGEYDARTIAYIVCLGVTVTHFVVSVGLFVRLHARGTHPIRGHSLSLVLAATISTAVISATNAATFIAPWPRLPCWVRLLFIFNFTTVAAVTYIARAWRIYFYYHKQAEQIAQWSNTLGLSSVPSRVSIASIVPEVDSPSHSKRSLGSSASMSASVSASESASASASRTAQSKESLGSSASVPASASQAARHPIISFVKEEQFVRVGSTSAFEREVEYDFAWYSDTKLVAATLIIALILVVAEDIPFFLNENMSMSDVYDLSDVVEACNSYRTSVNVAVGVVVAGIVFLVYTSFKLRHIEDGYLIKTELKIATGLGAIIATVYGLPGGLTSAAGVQLFMIVVGNLILFNTSTWKVYQALRFAREQRRSDAAASAAADDKAKEKDSCQVVVDISKGMGAAPDLDLSTVLDNRATRLKFRDHLKVEWSVENLLFYEATQKFRAMCASTKYSNADCVRVANTIVQRFIVADSPSWVNLSSKNSTLLISRVESLFLVEAVPDDLFDAACTEVFNLMESDSFRTFKRKRSTKELFEQELERLGTAIRDRPRSILP